MHYDTIRDLKERYNALSLDSENPSSNTHVIRGGLFSTIANQRSEFVASGYSGSFTGQLPTTNGHEESNGIVQNGLNGTVHHHSTVQNGVNGTDHHHFTVHNDNGVNVTGHHHSTVQQVDCIDCQNDYAARAKAQHEIKRKYLFSQTERLTTENFSHKPPRHRAYSSEDTRCKSFLGWKSESELAALIFAKSGFFYKGFGDIAACFQCGFVHKKWLKTDDPIIVHTRLQPGCSFIAELRNGGIVSSQTFINEFTENDIEMKEEVCTNGAENLSLPSDESSTNLLCKVCLVNKLELVILPCGHFSVCESCCNRLSSCPICRGAIESTIRSILLNGEKF